MAGSACGHSRLLSACHSRLNHELILLPSARLDLDSNLPLVVGELATNRSLTVRAAQYNVAQVIPSVGFASSSNLQTLAPDDPHFTAAGALIMGQRMAAVLEIPPLTLTSASIVGTNLLVTATGLAGATCGLEATTNLTRPKRTAGNGARRLRRFTGRKIFCHQITVGG